MFLCILLLSLCIIFRTQLYNSRKKHLKNSSEEKLWNEINWEFMSEESEVDESTIRKHSLQFQSDGKGTYCTTPCMVNFLISWLPG